MLNVRQVVLAAALITAAARPALAETCNFTIGGTKVLDDAACTVTKAKGVTRIDAGPMGTIVIRRSVLITSLAGDRSLARRVAKRHGVYSYGRVVEANDNDRLCYSGQNAVLCADQ